MHKTGASLSCISYSYYMICWMVNSRRKKNAVIQSYSNGFLGFAAYLSEDEAKSIAQTPGVVSVFPDPVLQLHTTHSWDFLKDQTAVEVNSNPSSTSGSISNGADTIIGILDTGSTKFSILFLI